MALGLSNWEDGRAILGNSKMRRERSRFWGVRKVKGFISDSSDLTPSGNVAGVCGLVNVELREQWGWV